MKIAVVCATRHCGCTLKDVAGSFGTFFSIGRSASAKFLEMAKARIAALPNIIIAYLDSMLSKHGAEIRVLEINSLRDLVPADLYLIASSIVECNFEREVGREAKRRFKSRVGYFGAFAAEVPEFYAEADFIVDGEVENLARDLAKGEIPEGVVTAGFVEDLESLPFPCWDQFDVGRYSYQTITTRGITLPMLGSRGCAFKCGYCPYKVRSVYRSRNVESLADEIEYLKKKYDVYGISFRDPLRLFGKEGAAEFAEELLRRGLDIRFSMEARTDKLDVETLDALYRAGLRSLEMGVESANAETLKNFFRMSAPQSYQREIIDHCHRIGIRVIANYMFGLPNETEEDMRRTLRYAKELNTFAVQFCVATPYPGTRLYHKVKDEIFEKDWESFNSWTSVFRHPYMTPRELHALREYAYVTYHFRPRYVWRFLKSTVLYPFFHGA